MKPVKPFSRFLLGALAALAFAAAGFTTYRAVIPMRGSTPEEISRALPGDEQVPDPDLVWNHAVTIHAPAEQVYPWLIQMGDSRAAFYSITFIENAFCALSGECRYVNADKIHPEWQNPARGVQGMIMDYMVINDTRPGEYVLAGAAPKLGLNWTWLWSVQPVDGGTSRLIVRHRIAYPPGVPPFVMETVFNAGYVMERAMLLGIRARAEGRIPPPAAEPSGALVWLLVLAVGIAAAVRFVRGSGGYGSLGIGLAAVAVLFILTFEQPELWVRWLLLLVTAAGLALTFRRG